MIVGQPGSGKSTLARVLGEITGLPVFHMDMIHWKPGLVERPLAEKIPMAHAVEARPRWIFEGGLSATYETRLACADTLVVLDLPLWRRAWRVFWRTLRGHGSTRPDLPENCPERFDLEFWHYIWRTRRSGRVRIIALIDKAHAGVAVHWLRSAAQVRQFLQAARG